MYYLNIIDGLNKIMENFKSFVFEHYDNPFMWLAFFLIGLAIFGIVYSSLQKEK